MSDRPLGDVFFKFSDALIAHSSQADGNPINHRLWAGFNWPPLSIPAEEPVSSSPEAVSRAGPANAATRGSMSSLLRSVPSGLTPVVAMPGVSFQSRAEQVGHPANFASWSKLAVCFLPSVARGVFHAAICATILRSDKVTPIDAEPLAMLSRFR
jgi:hypothetical protein